jgi:hypothetical protein
MDGPLLAARCLPPSRMSLHAGISRNGLLRRNDDLAAKTIGHSATDGNDLSGKLPQPRCVPRHFFNSLEILCLAFVAA